MPICINCDHFFVCSLKNDDVDRCEHLAIRRAHWKYFKKQNKAVCTGCSFERDLDINFGKAISCPNCGAIMD